MSKRRGRAIDGIVLLDKPVGMSSNHVLQRVKRLFSAAKAGHTGSLDPAASGLLPICFGKATKISGLLLDSDKYYQVSARFGEKTDSGDLEGRVIERGGGCALDQGEFARIVAGFQGESEQVPPMHSALKHQGKRLYKLARAGETVKRPPRKICLHELKLTEYRPDGFTLTVAASKGTYIRTLVEDIAAKAGCLAVTTDLRRIGLGPWPPTAFTAIDNSGPSVHMITLETLESIKNEQGTAGLDRVILPVDSALQSYPAVVLDWESTYHIRHGHPVFVARAPQTGWFRLYGPDDLFLGMGEVLDDGRVAPRRMFAALQ